MSDTAWFILLLLLLVFERLMELRAATGNFQRLLTSGGKEFGAPHYSLIVAMHTAFFFSLIVEFILRGEPLAPFWLVPLAIFILAQLLRFWSRHTMGKRWTTRIVVVPGEQLIKSGPFRFLKHPIYAAVALELFSVPLIFGLYWSCIIFTVLDAVVLLRVRIPMELAALEWSQALSQDKLQS